jgi:PAS domain S-box-containing protein
MDQSPRMKWIAMLPALAGLYALVGGIVSFLGWMLDIQRLTDWDGDGISIQPNATVCVIFSAAALLALAAGRHRIASVGGAVVLLIGGLTLLQWIGGFSFGLDAPLMFGREWGRVGVLYPGRMGPIGSLAWTLIGVALVLSAALPRWRSLASALAVTTAVICAPSLVGYCYGVGPLYNLPQFTIIALQTSTFIMAVSAGLIASHPDCEPMRMLLDPGGAGLLARRVLPLMLVVPVVLGWLQVRGQNAGWYDAGLGTALLVILLIVFLAAVLSWSLAILRSRDQVERQSSQRVREILGSITDVFLTLDKDWRFTFLNEQAVDRAGRSDLLGKNLWEEFPAFVSTEGFGQLRRAMAERVSVEYEVYYEPWQCWLRDKAYPTADGGLAVYSQDVTPRKQAEEKLRVKEVELENITENTSAMLTRCSRDLRYQFVNKAYADFLGLPREQIQGSLIETILGPRALAAILPRIERVLRGETVEYEEEVPFDRPGPRWVLARYVPNFDGAGQVQGWYASVQDITPRKQAEEKLRESEALFRTLGEAVPDFLWMADADGRPIYQNPAWRKYVGLTHDELARRGWEALHHPDDVPRLRAVWAEMAARGEAIRVEVRTRRHDGEYRWFAGRTVPLKDEAGRVVKWVGTMTDIHDLKCAEEALRDADRKKDEFLAVLAHELRNPLAPVRNAVQILRLKGPVVPELQWARDVIDRQMQQMTRLIDDLMDASRISRGKIELKRERVELAQVVRGAVETSRPLIEQCGHELVVDLPPLPMYLDADVTRLAQALCNLLNNAAKYTERGGRIVLTAERQGSDAVIGVRDSGIGIAPDMLPRVFEMFTQADRSLEKTHGGLGIGLSLVKRLVEMHGGRVEARSEGLGRGSEFVVRLPVLIEPPTAVPAASSAEIGASLTSSHRVLIVDDNRDAADSLGMMLRAVGNDIRTAYDGVEAARVAGEFRPHVILLDIGLPRMNGYETARTIRREPWGKSVTLIAMTGWGQEEDRRRSKDAGFDRHMVKPVAPVALLEFLASLPVEPGCQLSRRHE